MNPLIAWWFRKLVSFTLVIDRMNTTNDKFIAMCCQGIRLIAYDAAAYADGDTEDTQQLEPVAEVENHADTKPLGGLTGYIEGRESA